MEKTGFKLRHQLWNGKRTDNMVIPAGSDGASGVREQAAARPLFRAGHALGRGFAVFRRWGGCLRRLSVR